MIRLPPLEAVTGLVTVVLQLLAEIGRAGMVLARWQTNRRPAVSYITEHLSLALDITDHRGERAVLTRAHQVQFLVGESGVLREPVWGDGEPLGGYRVRGARHLGTRAEGQTRSVLLGLARPAIAGERATVTSRRTIRNGLRGSEEYLAATLERPTERLTMHVHFPAARPPHRAQLISIPTGGPPRRIPVRLGPDGRPLLTWRARKPKPDHTYMLSWSW